jgi:uncharacterized alpha-E superfamily protein
VIARVADHCFWLGRYVERAESTARVLQVTRNLSLDTSLTPHQCWWPVLIVSGEEPHLGSEPGAELDDGEAVQHHLTWDGESATSIRRSIAAARENARSTREVVSLETWEALNELHLWMGSPDARARWQYDRDGFYRHVRRTCQLAAGLVDGTMLHDAPYHFIALGAMLERTGQTARILDVHHHALAALAAHEVVETAVFFALLRACSAFEPFMKRNRGPITPLAVTSFLVLEHDFPRSIRFAISAAYRRLARIRPPDAIGEPGAGCLERLRRFDTWIAAQGAGALAESGIHDLLTRVVDETAAICDGVGRELLGHESAEGAQ